MTAPPPHRHQGRGAGQSWLGWGLSHTGLLVAPAFPARLQACLLRGRRPAKECQGHPLVLLLLTPAFKSWLYHKQQEGVHGATVDRGVRRVNKGLQAEAVYLTLNLTPHQKKDGQPCPGSKASCSVGPKGHISDLQLKSWEELLKQEKQRNTTTDSQGLKMKWDSIGASRKIRCQIQIIPKFTNIHWTILPQIVPPTLRPASSQAIILNRPHISVGALQEWEPQSPSSTRLSTSIERSGFSF